MQMIRKPPENYQVNFACTETNETVYPLWIKFFVMVETHNVITCENYGDNRLMGIGMAGKIYPFLHGYIAVLGHYRNHVLILTVA